MTGPIADGSRTRTGTGTRDREAYFAAAMELLAERGCDAVTIAGLCERLLVTHGSFYHHFENMPAFVVAFAGHWQALVLGL
jgi:AcrR family transcriptional regulator